MPATFISTANPLIVDVNTTWTHENRYYYTDDSNAETSSYNFSGMTLIMEIRKSYNANILFTFDEDNGRIQRMDPCAGAIGDGKLRFNLKSAETRSLVTEAGAEGATFIYDLLGVFPDADKTTVKIETGAFKILPTVTLNT